ncbi:lycopene beta-cyclase CrtY [Altererythrobacter litoralis]|uniref:Lycopene beta-cyclase CrtY n=1 Tax=Altererythrobacter litoralis TaxID=3113904 RepID=A0ABU7GGE6_9SPHN|nr:lycopene beta-cyclase CrtY [Erythrobacteraceae bacterium 1XM1-14]
MNGRMTDVAIVGGGLAGGLIALALHRAHPEWRLQLLERGATLGGNHRWSWFSSDLSHEGEALLEPFRQIRWDDGYDVAFPRRRRQLAAGYRSLASEDFDSGLKRLLPPEAIRLNAGVAELDAAGVTLDGGERVRARTVIDCRNFSPSPHLLGGWQIFMGRHLKLGEAHGIARPVIMDATVAQSAPAGNGGAYRFVYVLPLAAQEVFIEDTYYAEDPALDRSLLSSRLDRYAARHGWAEGLPVGHETGILPVITGGNFGAYLASIREPGVAVAGARGGFTHPLTSYTVPIAVENALAIAEQGDLAGAQLARFCEDRARAHWQRTGIYRALGRMLFKAAEPERRVDIFERFYGLPEKLIERFYACHSTLPDRLRILTGKPPVSIPRAIRALAGKGQPLTMERMT